MHIANNILGMYKNTCTGDTAKGSFAECPIFAAVPS